GGTDEIGGERRQHGSAGHARDRRKRENSERQRRQDQLLESCKEQLAITRDQAVDEIKARHLRRRAEENIEPAERRRRPAQKIVEDVDQDQPGEENGQGYPGRRDEAEAVIDDGIRPG